MNRYVCIHGHFYQPPRENPWLEAIESQDSARPYHDWNERIASECYGPNAASRILGADKKIIKMVNNYASISFDFGPTLLSWMERHAPEDYENVLKADKESREKFSGHGAAIAQVYNHMIMPLANVRDQRTQVIWGIRDFEHRFKRKPEGMWLAETAVDIPTLEALAEHGILFTVLAPHQAASVRKISETETPSPWAGVKSGGLDPQTAYLCRLPSGRAINIFFYDGPVSREVAFADLLKDGEHFANRLLGLFPRETETAPAKLVHIATDGETYGHHHSYGEMALAYCLHHITTHNLARVTVYAEHLAKFPPAHEVQIVENTSWSCMHGLERWRSDCGCCIGGHRGWHQKWRAPLRAAMDWLRDRLVPLYERDMRELTGDPWAARDNYIGVVLDRSQQNVEKFLRENFRGELESAQKVRILKLLELQRHAMLMYTSCGWFFDEISGIEAVQILQYAGRVLQLARELFGQDFEMGFTALLETAPGNIADLRNGAAVYERFVKPAVADLSRVGVHYAVSAMFDNHPREKEIYCYTVRARNYDLRQSEGRMLVTGCAHIRSRITWEEGVVDFAVFHSGDHDLRAGARPQTSEEAFRAMQHEMDKAFANNNLPQEDRLMEQHFGAGKYALKYLFKDDQKRIFDEILRSTMEEFEAYLRGIYERYYPLMGVKEELHIALPKALVTCIEFILNRDLVDLLNREDTDIKALERVAADVKRWSFEIDKTGVRFAAVQKITLLMRRLQEAPRDTRLLQLVHDILRALAPLHLNLDLWRAQTAYLDISRQLHVPGRHPPAGSLPAAGKDPHWDGLFKKLGDDLQVRHL